MLFKDIEEGQGGFLDQPKFDSFLRPDFLPDWMTKPIIGGPQTTATPMPATAQQLAEMYTNIYKNAQLKSQMGIDQ